MTSPASTRSVPKHVTVCEVGPRDGLQNEPTAVSADDKVSYINLLLEAGFRDIEVTSFVNPKAVPQLADAEAVFPRVHKLPGRRYICLVPNERGLDRALTAGAQAIAVFTAASDSFAKRNIGMTIDRRGRGRRRASSRLQTAESRISLDNWVIIPGMAGSM